MKISNTPTSIKEQQPSTPLTPARPATDEAIKLGSGETSRRGATVELSNTAAAMLSPAYATSSEFDAEKVARIAQAIADGKFTINAEAIADKLIANAQELLGKTTG